MEAGSFGLFARMTGFFSKTGELLGSPSTVPSSCSKLGAIQNFDRFKIDGTQGDHSTWGREW
jgi:hypothetical protein